MTYLSLAKFTMAKDHTSKTQDYRTRLDSLTESILAKSSYTINQIQDTLKQTTILKRQSQSQSNGKLNQLTINLAQYQKYLSQLNTLLLRTEFFEDQLTLLETDITRSIKNSNNNSTWDDLNLRTIESTMENLCLEFKHLSKRIEALARQELLDIYSGRLPVVQSPSKPQPTNKRLSINAEELLGLGVNTIAGGDFSLGGNNNVENMSPSQVKRHSYTNSNRHSYHSIQRTPLTPRTPLSQTFNANDFKDEESEEDEHYKSDDSEGTASEKFFSQLKPIRCVSTVRQSSMPNIPTVGSEVEPPSSSLTSQSSSTASIVRRASLRNSMNSNKFNLLASIPRSHSESRSARNSMLIEGMDLGIASPNSIVNDIDERLKKKNRNRNTLDSTGLDSSFQSDSLFSQRRSSSIDTNGAFNENIGRCSPTESLSPRRSDAKPDQKQKYSPLTNKSNLSRPRQLKFKAKSIANFPPKLNLDITPNLSTFSESHGSLDLEDPFKDKHSQRQSINLRHFSSCDTGLKLNFAIIQSGNKENAIAADCVGPLNKPFKEEQEEIRGRGQESKEEEDNQECDLTNGSVIVRHGEGDVQEVAYQHDGIKEQFLEAKSDKQAEQLPEEDFRGELEQCTKPSDQPKLQTLAEDEEFSATFEHKLNRSNSLDSIFSVMTSKVPIVPANAPLPPSTAVNGSKHHIHHFSKPTLTWMRNISHSAHLSSATISHQPSISNMSSEVINTGISLNKVTMISVNTPSTKTFALNSKTKQNLSNLLSGAGAGAGVNSIDDKSVKRNTDSRINSSNSLAGTAKVTENVKNVSIFNRLFSSSSSLSNSSATSGVKDSTIETAEVKPSALSSLNKNMLRHQTSLQSLKEQAGLEEGQPFDIQQVLNNKKSMKTLSHKQSILALSPPNHNQNAITSSTKPITISHSSKNYHSFEEPPPSGQASSKYINSRMLDSFITTINSYIPSYNPAFSEVGRPVSQQSTANTVLNSSASGEMSVKTHYLQTHRPTSKIDAVVASTSSSLKFVSSGSNTIGKRNDSSTTHSGTDQGSSKLIMGPKGRVFIGNDYRGGYGKDLVKVDMVLGSDIDQGATDGGGLGSAIRESLV